MSTPFTRSYETVRFSFDQTWAEYQSEMVVPERQRDTLFTIEVSDGESISFANLNREQVMALREIIDQAVADHDAWIAENTADANAQAQQTVQENQ